MATILASIFAFLNASFEVVCGFVELLTLDPIFGFRATSLRSPVPQLGLRSFVVTELSLDVVSMTPQTTCSAAHLSRSC